MDDKDWLAQRFVQHRTHSFEEIAPMVGRSPTAARKLASRARW